jgi:hypothetical protein
MLSMRTGLRVVFCLFAVAALVGGCSSMGPQNLAYQTAYSAVGAQVK